MRSRCRQWASDQSGSWYCMATESADSCTPMKVVKSRASGSVQPPTTLSATGTETVFSPVAETDSVPA